MTLPQPEISVFSGDPVEYSGFVRDLENLIESKTSSPNSGLYYLVQLIYVRGSEGVNAKLFIDKSQRRLQDCKSTP